MKRTRMAVIILATVLIATLVIFNVPGNIPPATEAGVRLPPLTASSADVDLYLLATGHAETPEAFTMAQGSLFKSFAMIHGAVLVTHGDDSFLFDTGLGRQVDSQFSEDMPFWLKSLMAYEKAEPVADQLQENENLPPAKRIFLSHAHWDHASGVIDFPDLEIWIPSAEYAYLKSGVPPSIFPSQVESPDIQWKEYVLKEASYAGFPRSYDMYGDGTVVLVGLAGHTPGSVGLFVNAKDGVRRFFVGDAVWNLKAVQELKRKFWLSSLLVDNDRAETDVVVAKLHALMQANPELKVIPAHDLSTWH
jgi:glyoxylase-like metal-dependent hydrolase (beta-lactamase superfamily II)